MVAERVAAAPMLPSGHFIVVASKVIITFGLFLIVDC